MKIILPLTLLSFAHAFGADWPQWRGPLANGTAPDAAPPTTWSESQNVKWKVKIPGEGNSTPIIIGDKIFVMTAVPTGKKVEPPKPEAAPGAKPEGTPASATPPAPAATPRPPEGARPEGGQGRPEGAPPRPEGGQPGERPRRRGGFGPGGGGGGGGFGRGEKPTEPMQFTVMCLDRETGKTIWQKAAHEEVPHEGHHGDGTHASGSPITDGQHVYASFGSRGIYCLDMKGEVKWKKDLGDMRTKNGFGEGTSPALHGDTLIVKWDHEGDDFIVALDKKTGAERWRQKRDEITSWSTPLIVEHEGKAQVITTATKRVRAYDLATGAPLWECGGMTDNVIPTPVAGFGMVYPMSGFRGAALLAVKLGSMGSLDGTEAIAWKHGKATPYVPSPLLVGERLYFLSGNNALLSCFNAKTGAPLFEAQRLDMNGVYASPVAAADRIYVVGRDGKTAVVKQGDTLEVIATNKLDERIDASPAIAGKEIFLRGRQSLYCIAE